MDGLDDFIFSEKDINGIKRYFVTYVHKIYGFENEEVSKQVYEGMLNLKKEHRNLLRSDERHIEQSEQQENTVYQKTKSSDYIFIDDCLKEIHNKALRDAIVSCLTKRQRFRIIQKYWRGLTCEEIAEFEGCTHQAVSESIRRARKRLKKKLGEDYFLNKKPL